jgi:hypothetical protein
LEGISASGFVGVASRPQPKVVATKTRTQRSQALQEINSPSMGHLTRTCMMQMGAEADWFVAGKLPTSEIAR